MNRRRDMWLRVFRPWNLNHPRPPSPFHVFVCISDSQEALVMG